MLLFPSLSPRGLAAWVSILPANFPLKKVKVNWACHSQVDAWIRSPGANYGTTLDKSQYMLWKALCITTYKFLITCAHGQPVKGSAGKWVICWFMYIRSVLCSMLEQTGLCGWEIMGGWEKEGNSLISRSAWKMVSFCSSLSISGVLEKIEGTSVSFCKQWKEWSLNSRWWGCWGHILYALASG